MASGPSGGGEAAVGETAEATASMTPRRAGGALAGGTTPPPIRDPAFASTVAAGAVAESDELVGTSVGRYRVLAKIGAGGMGVVYRAFDPALDRTIALKVLPPLDEDRRTHLEERLRREAQALARLDHHNVVAVYDVGIAEASLFVAMQFVDGATLDDHLRDHPQRPRKVLALFVAAGRGLAAAHAADIIHRDVKPSNILVDRSGRVYVGDFGLARGAGELDRPDGSAPRCAGAGDRSSAGDLLVAEMTRAGAVLGTPLFMAPEQHRGEAATARSDQFSFCVSVWYQLFGHHPFEDNRTADRAPAPWDHARALAAMEADRIGEPPRLPGLPARVVRAVRRGLRHDPDARWPSMTALLAELEPRSRAGWVLGGLTVAGLASGAFATAIAVGGASDRDPCANAADRLASSVTPDRMHELVGKLSGIGLPYAATTATGVEAEIDRYARDWSTMRIDACRANRVRRDQSDELFDRRVACLDQRAAALDGAVGVLLAPPTPDVLDRAMSMIAGLPPLADCADLARLGAAAVQPADPALRARIAALSDVLERARASLAAGRLEGSVATAERLVADARAIGWSPLLGRALRHAADAHRWAGKLDVATARLRESSMEAARGHDDTAAAEAITKVAYLLAEAGRPADALLVIDDAEVLVRRAGDTASLRSMLEGTRGDALGHAARLREADAAYTRAIRIVRGEPAGHDLLIAQLLVDQAGFLKQGNETTRARDALLEAQRIYVRYLTSDHPLLATLHQVLGNLYLQLKDIPRGKAEHDRAIAILEARYSPDHPSVAAVEFDRGLAAIHESRLDEAAAAFDDAFRRLLRSQPDHPHTYNALYMLGTVRLQQARYDEALTIYQRVLDWRLRKLGDAHTATANVLDAIGEVYHARDDYPTALARMKQAQVIRENALGADNPDVALSLQSIAALALDRGDCAEATRLSQRALAILDQANSPDHMRIDAVGALATCELKAGHIAAARTRFEQLLAMVDAPNAATVDQRTTARIDFAELLERAGDRPRARRLVEEAAGLFVAAKRNPEAAAQRRWLATHR